MNNHFKGALLHAHEHLGALSWLGDPNAGDNQIKWSSITEIYHDLANPKFHISVPINGVEHYKVGQQHYQVGKGQYMLHLPNKPILAEANYAKPVDGLCFFLHEATLQQTLSHIQYPLLEQVSNRHELSLKETDEVLFKFDLQENDLGQMLHQIANIIEVNKDEIVFDSDSLFLQLSTQMLQALHQLNAGYEKLPFVKTETKREMHKRTVLAHHIIIDNYEKPLKLNQIATLANVSPYHLLRLYKQLYQVTPHQQILQLRVSKAKQLLKLQYDSEEIAQLLSFSDRRAFGKVFKKFTGITPNAYRALV